MTGTIPLAIPNLTGNEARYLQECIDTNFVSSVGPFVDRFETMVAAACGTEHAVATASGTAALHLMLAAHGIGSGDLVILPAFSFIATANAVSYTGAQPAMVDISPESWTMSPTALARFLENDCERRDDRVLYRPTGARIAAVMCVHTLGHPADIDRLADVAASWNLPLLCDAAAAIGSRYRDRPVGMLGHAAALSFNGNKTVTCGGGGAVVSGNAALLARIRHLSTTARRTTDYEHDAVGFNYRMTNLQAAVGCAQMERLDALIAAKRRIAARYAEALADIPGVLPFPVASWAMSAYWFSGVVLATPGAGAVVDALGRAGIGARRFWKPLHRQPPYAGCPRGALPVSEGLEDRIVTLPCSTGLTDAEQDRTIEAVRAALRPPARAAG